MCRLMADVLKTASTFLGGTSVPAERDFSSWRTAGIAPIGMSVQRTIAVTNAKTFMAASVVHAQRASTSGKTCLLALVSYLC